MSYSIDLRERVIKYIEEGGSKVEAAHIFDVCRVTIYSWLKKKVVKGTLKDDPPKRRWKKLEPQALLAYVQQYPDLRLSDYAKHFGASIPSVFLALKRLKITRKKRPHSIKRGVKKNVQHFWSISVSIQKNP
jgi:putative transposase